MLFVLIWSSLLELLITRGCAAAHRATRDCQNPDRTPEVPPTTHIWTDALTPRPYIVIDQINDHKHE